MSWSLKQGEGRAGGVLRWAAHPLGGAVRRDHGQYPASAPGTSGEAAGFGPFCILLFIICPNCTGMQLFLVPCSFFVFCCFVQVQALQKRVPGPSLSHNEFVLNQGLGLFQFLASEFLREKGGKL